MDLKEAREKLIEEGFTNVYLQEDEPETFYPEHLHAKETAHVVLDGKMTITLLGETRVLAPGFRFDVPANTLHYAKVGPEGCRYLVGEKD